ncbi:hypothetical protein HYQ45_008353 [Verticillium longisporum]|uniref:Filamentation protein n=1 Tax=Verticillium longisporum TaxID=100787 RepID=A0A8I3APE9_VERLO|nr:hypothetical protein HYQ45_008353 [Verticillium longisporum]
MPDATKAAHYIQALDAARAEGNWQAVPEFVRKIRKHAPDRTCLTLTAELEYAVSTSSKSSSNTASRPQTARPQTATAPASDVDTAEQISKLLEIIENDDLHPEDKFQAQVAVGWVHWTSKEYRLAATRLPSTLDQQNIQDPDNKVSEWTSVCSLKAAYLKADCLVVSGQREEALRIFEAALPAATAIWSRKTGGKQLRYCSELFLTEFCMLQSEALQFNERSLQDMDSLACYRSWARYWEAFTVVGGQGYRGSVPRRRVWNEYYSALSNILDLNLPYPTGSLPAMTTEMSPRSLLRVELKKVEAAFEALLIAETQFPKADEEREEVEEFAKSVMKNWSILCGRGWREEDLGEGGRESVSRGALDVFYRAATKTYHSTAILRFIFTVHLSVAEFDLAFKAFDSYLELVKHGKARVDKTGHSEGGLDDDGTVLETISQCILALCRYGGKDAIEKAKDLGAELEDWMARLPQLRAGVSDGTTLPELEETTSTLHPEISPRSVALSWQAVGLSHAHWSRVTHDAGSRVELQAKAIRCLRKAVSPKLGRTRDVRSLFALGLLLAERRELSPAIEIVKTALIAHKSSDDVQNHYHGPNWQQRSLLPLWHLLALLMSARQDYAMAERSCEGAFEQFGDDTILFGGSKEGFRSDHLNDLDEKHANAHSAVVDEMDDFERESILEVKMTQLALVEVVEGPEFAVNASHELLSLFQRLFGDVKPSKPTLNLPTTTEVPKSSAGTLRSIRGSIFGGRSERTGRTSRRTSLLESEKSVALSTRPPTSQTSAGVAPTIQVTGESGQVTERKPSRRLRGRSESGRRNSLKKRESSSSRKRAPSLGPPIHSPTVVDGEVFFTPTTEIPLTDFLGSANGGRQQASGFTGPRGQTLNHLDSYTSQASKSTAYSYSEISADATYTITNPLPVIKFAQEVQRKQRTILLVKVWLMIAGFYRRAEMYEDCRGAVGEAQKLVQGLDTERSASENAASYRNAGWAERKSIDELWGDVWAELGYLSLAKEAPYDARSEFESALTHFPNHPAAIVGLSSILLDIFTEQIRPPPAVPSLSTEDGLFDSDLTPSASLPRITTPVDGLRSEPLGLGSGKSVNAEHHAESCIIHDKDSKTEDDDKLPAPYKASSLPLIDRLAARDRASGLLTGLTKLGSAWDYSEAWFALARAHEESGLPERAKEVLWWCVELEEGRGVREWRCLGSGGYVL